MMCIKPWLKQSGLLFRKYLINFKKVLTNIRSLDIIANVLENGAENYGVWLSLARAPGLGPGGRRFESCHPDTYAGVVQW